MLRRRLDDGGTLRTLSKGNAHDLGCSATSRRELYVIMASKLISLELTHVNIDFCVPESQRLADLFGVAQDLETACRYCELHIEIDPTASGISPEEMTRREHTRQALGRAALISYGRAWGSGMRSGLGDDFLKRLSEADQENHRILKSLRDRWVAHAVNYFEEVKIVVSLNTREDGCPEAEAVQIQAQGVGGFVMAWTIACKEHCSRVLAHVREDIQIESDRVLHLAKNLPVSELIARGQVTLANFGETLDPLRPRKRFRA